MKRFGFTRPMFIDFQRVSDDPDSDSLLKCEDDPQDYEDVPPHRFRYRDQYSLGTHVFRISIIVLLLYISVVSTIETVYSKRSDPPVEVDHQYIPESILCLSLENVHC